MIAFRAVPNCRRVSRASLVIGAFVNGPAGVRLVSLRLARRPSHADTPSSSSSSSSPFHATTAKSAAAPGAGAGVAAEPAESDAPSTAAASSSSRAAEATGSGKGDLVRFEAFCSLHETRHHHCVRVSGALLLDSWSCSPVPAPSSIISISLRLSPCPDLSHSHRPVSGGSG